MDDQSFLFARVVFGTVFALLGAVLVITSTGLNCAVIGGILIVAALAELHDVLTYDDGWPNG